MSIRPFFSRMRRMQPEQEPQPLRIEGIAPAPLTPEPDDAELAAAALLELMASKDNADGRKRKDKGQSTPLTSDKEDRGKVKAPETIHDASYYRELTERIREARRAAMLRAMRFVSFVEQELLKPDLPAHGPGSLGLLEAELFKRIDIIERCGGNLKKRWQHCLADVILRLMRAEPPLSEEKDRDA